MNKNMYGILREARLHFAAHTTAYSGVCPAIWAARLVDSSAGYSDTQKLLKWVWDLLDGHETLNNWLTAHSADYVKVYSSSENVNSYHKLCADKFHTTNLAWLDWMVAQYGQEVTILWDGNDDSFFNIVKHLMFAEENSWQRKGKLIQITINGQTAELRPGDYLKLDILEP